MFDIPDIFLIFSFPAHAGVDPKDPSALARAFPSFHRRLRAPSPIWVVAAPAAQIPVFVSGVLAVRRVAEGGAEIGLGDGGAFWFPDLTARAVDTARWEGNEGRNPPT